MTAITEQQIKDTAAAYKAAAAKVDALRDELRNAEHAARNAHETAVHTERLFRFQIRESKFKADAREAIEQAKALAGIPQYFPTEQLVGNIYFDIPFRSHYGDSSLRIQPKDYSKRARIYKQNKNGRFNIKAIAALFAESMPN